MALKAQRQAGCRASLARRRGPKPGLWRRGVFRRATQNRTVCSSGDEVPESCRRSPCPSAIWRSPSRSRSPLPRARADCIAEAAARHHVNADVLRAIGWQESRLQPQAAVGHNANGSIDVGAFQINSIHLSELARYGIDRRALADGCVCADVAAWHYRRQVDSARRHLAAPWGRTTRDTSVRAAWYANRIAAILMRWNVMPPAGPLPFQVGATRVHRSMRPLLSAPLPRGRIARQRHAIRHRQLRRLTAPSPFFRPRADSALQPRARPP